MANIEQVEFRVNPEQYIQGLLKMNQANQGFENQTTKTGQVIQDRIDAITKVVVSAYDKQAQASERVITSLEKRAATEGKSGTEKLIADRDALIKKYGNEEEAIKRITAAYEKLIEKQKEGGSEGGFKAFGEGIKEFLENPIQGAQGAVTGLLEKFGAFGVAAGATIGVVAALGAAVFEGAKQFGEFGIRMRDAELRTGLGAKALGEFTYAAKAAGTDISAVEGIMRALVMSLDAGGQKAAQASEWLEKWGIDVHAVKNGTADFQETLMKISTGLEELPAGFERSSAAMEVLRRQGINYLPFLVELKENIQHAQEAGDGYSQAMIDAGVKTQKATADAAMGWERLKLSIEGTAGAIYLYMAAQNQRDPTYKTLGTIHPPGVGGAPSIGLQTSSDNQRAMADRSNLSKDLGTEQGMHYQLQQAEKKQSEALKDVNTTTPGSKDFEKAHDNFEKANADVTALTAKLEALKKAKEEALKMAKVRPFMGPVYGPEIHDDHTLQNMATATPVLSNPGNNLSDVQDRNKSLQDQWKQQEEAQKATLTYEEAILKIQAGPGGEAETAKKIYDLRMAAAENDLQKYQAGLDYLKQMAEAQEKADEAHQKALDDAEKKQQEMLNKENEQLAKTASGLYDTLLTHPSKFGAQLGHTLQQKSTKSASDMLGQMTADYLIPGGAKANQSPIEKATDINTQATVQNTAAIAQMTGHIAASMGVQPPAIPSVSGTTSTVPAVSVPAVTPAMLSFGGGGFIPSLGPGGTSGFSGPVGGSGGGFNPLASIMGSSKSQGGGFNLGSLFGGQGGGMGGLYSRTSSPFGGGMASDAGGFGDSDNPLGPQMAPTTGGMTGGVGGMAGGMLGSVGMSLAMNGLTGKNAGTGTGILEGAGGGAMIGAQYAGPVGALIGAAAGAAAGLGEMLAGVMSPQAKAQKYCKEYYGITINPQMQNQIVQIANSKYAGDINTTCRSPEVRQMLGLYAQGTGQNSAKILMDSTPHGAGLSMQNGNLYQDASYQSGQAFNYQSAMPTLGGGPGAQGYNSPTNYPGSSSGTNLTLNIDGKGAGAFMAGNVVTSDFVNDQWQASQQNSDGRVDNSALMLSPGLITA